MQRNPVLDIILHLLRGEVLLEARADHSRRDAIDPDIRCSKIARQAPRELWQRSLHNTISYRIRAAAEAGSGADQNDSSLLFPLHGGKGRTAKMEYGVKVNIEGGVPVFRCDIEDVPGRRSSGAVHQNIGIAQDPAGFLHAKQGRCGIAQVRHYQMTAPAELFDGATNLTRRGVVVPGTDADIGSASRQLQGGSRSNAPRSSGNQADLSF
jgi:hypothetical protein